MLTQSLSWREVLAIDLPWLDRITRAKKPPRPPVVLSTTEVQRLLAHLEGTHHLVASLLYGSRLRLMEAQRLRVKDVDLDRLEITVRSGKGGKDRRRILPRPLVGPLAQQINRVAVFHERDVRNGLPSVYLPHALARKHPNAGRELGWQFLFPAPRPSRDPRSGVVRRHHLHSANFQRAIKKAVRAAETSWPL